MNLLLTITLLISSGILQAQPPANYPQIPVQETDSARAAKMNRLIKELYNYDKIIGFQFKEFNTVDLKGNAHSIDDFTGKITLVDFWFSTCGPCVEDFPVLRHIDSVYENTPQFQIVSFCRDSKEEATATIGKFSLYYQVNCMDNDDIYRLNFNKGFPLKLLVNQHCKIINVLDYKCDLECIKSQINEAIRLLTNK